MSFARRMALVTITLVFAAGTLAGQAATGLSPADTREIAAYRLSIEGLRRYEKAMVAFSTEMKKDPKVQNLMKLQAELKTLKAKDEPTDADYERVSALESRIEALEEQLGPAEGATTMSNAKSLSEMADGAAKFPAFASALRSAGMTPREYAVFTMALFQASMYAAMKKGGVLKAKDIPASVSTQHITFVEQNEAALTAMQKRFAAESGTP